MDPSRELVLIPRLPSSLTSQVRVLICSEFVSFLKVNQCIPSDLLAHNSTSLRCVFVSFRTILSQSEINHPAWQLMTPQVGGTIDSAFLQRYDATVQSALNSGSDVFVIIDLVCFKFKLTASPCIHHFVPAQLRSLERRYHRSRRPYQRPIC